MAKTEKLYRDIAYALEESSRRSFFDGAESSRTMMRPQEIFEAIAQWPKRRVECRPFLEEPEWVKEPDRKVWWSVQKGTRASASAARFEFTARRAAILSADVDQMEEVSRQARRPIPDESMAPAAFYSTCLAVIDAWAAHLYALEVAKLEALRAREAEAIAEQRRAHVFPPLVGTDEDRVAETARVAWLVQLEYEMGKKYETYRVINSSEKSLLAKLKNADFKLDHFEEKPAGLCFEGMPFSQFKVAFVRLTHPELWTHIFFYNSRPSQVLIDQREAAKSARDPKTKKKPLSERTDIL